MPRNAASFLARLRTHRSSETLASNPFAEAALHRHKAEGLALAVRARWAALVAIAALLPFLNMPWEVLYFYVFMLGFAVIGYFQSKIGAAGRSQAELGLLFLDVALMTFMLTFPPPFQSTADWPTAMTYRFANFIYFFVILAAGTLSYNWRTLMAMGNATLVIWLTAVALVWLFGVTSEDLRLAMERALGDQPRMLEMLDPNALQLDLRLQEVAVFLIVCYTLALTSRRSEQLLLSHASLERARTNLARYFSPNMVDALARNDEPLREVREQDVAVLFVDLVGFTAYAAERSPHAVIDTLRSFHAQMEACVFAHGGTLDKYLGDGLMASFGTPLPGRHDTARALACAQSMLEAVDDLNMARAQDGHPPLLLSAGLHFGPAVLGDIGANRLEFTVIGNTVNIASRMESLTRNLATRFVLSDAAYEQARVEGVRLDAFAPVDGSVIKGLDITMRVWRLM